MQCTSIHEISRSLPQGNHICRSLCRQWSRLQSNYQRFSVRNGRMFYVHRSAEISCVLVQGCLPKYMWGMHMVVPLHTQLAFILSVDSRWVSSASLLRQYGDDIHLKLLHFGALGRRLLYLDTGCKEVITRLILRKTKLQHTSLSGNVLRLVSRPLPMHPDRYQLGTNLRCCFASYANRCIPCGKSRNI
jgi:hypothetical protein